MGQFGQEPEASQPTCMELVRFILGKFLGVVCHCFPPRLDVPTFDARCLHVRNEARDSSSERWNYGRERYKVIKLVASGLQSKSSARFNLHSTCFISPHGRFYDIAEVLMKILTSSYCCPCILIVVYVFLLLSMYSYCSSMYSYCCLRILIVVYVFLLFVHVFLTLSMYF